MELIADILLVAGALGAAFYCSVLARRLSRFNDLEGGMGGAVAVLSKQVDDMTRALEATRETAGHSAESLQALTQRAEAVAKRLELLVASMHDLPDADPGPEYERPGPPPPKETAPAPATEARKRSAVPFFMRRPEGDAQ